jgi:predicted DNA-binding protein (MmcQ/YjbR family)
MPKKDVKYEKVRAICLSFPDTKETITWGKPHFRVGEKIFAGYGEENGVCSVGFKLEMHHAKAVVTDKKFSPAPYVGHKGWVSMNAELPIDWDALREMIAESYRLIAPKKSLAKLEAAGGGLPASKKPAARKPAARR